MPSYFYFLFLFQALAEEGKGGGMMKLKASHPQLGSQLDLIRGPYVLYGVKYFDLVPPHPRVL